MVGNKRRRTNGGFDTTRREPHIDVSAPAVSQPTFISTFDRKFHYPVFSALCDCLSIAEIVTLTQTCKHFSDLYQCLLPIQWDVDKPLRHYVDDPQGFRSQMARSDALISGTFAAQFFERDFRDREPLEVWVHEGEGSELFVKYLSGIAGYSEIDLIVVDQVFLGKVERRKFTRGTDVKSAIRLITTHYPPVFVAASQADFTAQVNIMSWNKAYSVFALPTFILKTCYLLHSWDRRAADSANVLSRKGLNVQGVLWPEDKRCNHPIRARRRVADRYTWTIPFDTKNVQTSKTPDYVLEHAGFKCVGLAGEHDDNEPYRDCEGEIRNYFISMGILESKVLKYSYTFGDFAMREFFKARLHASTILELRKLNAAERPLNYEQILLHTSDTIDRALWGFNPPTSWIYRDDEVAKWYKAWEMHKPEDAYSK